MLCGVCNSHQNESSDGVSTGILSYSCGREKKPCFKGGYGFFWSFLWHNVKIGSCVQVERVVCRAPRNFQNKTRPTVDCEILFARKTRLCKIQGSPWCRSVFHSSEGNNKQSIPTQNRKNSRWYSYSRYTQYVKDYILPRVQTFGTQSLFSRTAKKKESTRKETRDKERKNKKCDKNSRRDETFTLQ